MRNCFLACVAFAIAATFHACKKDSVQNTPINPALQAAFNYKPGTFWIYKDSISGLVDSFFVTNNYTNKVSQSSTYTYDEIGIDITQYSISPVRNTDTQYWVYYYAGNNITMLYNEKRGGNTIIEYNYSPIVNYPFVNPISFTGNGLYLAIDTSTIYLLNSFSVSSQSFTNVALVNHRGTQPQHNLIPQFSFSDWFYICPEAGIVKMRLYHPEDSLYRVWELQRYNIKL